MLKVLSFFIGRIGKYKKEFELGEMIARRGDLVIMKTGRGWKFPCGLPGDIPIFEGLQSEVDLVKLVDPRDRSVFLDLIHPGQEVAPKIVRFSRPEKTSVVYYYELTVIDYHGMWWIWGRNETPRILLEEESRSQEIMESHFRTIIENMPVMLKAVDHRGQIVAWNRESERVTGYSFEEVRASGDFMDLLYPDESYRHQIQTSLERLKSGYRNLELDVRCRSGEVRSILWSDLSPQWPIPGWDSWTLGFDITEQRKIHKALITAKEEAEEAVKVKTAFLANVSHELRTPLSAVIGFSDLLSYELTDPEHRASVESISLAGKNLLRLINNILDLSKIEAGREVVKTTAVGLKEFVEEIRPLFVLQAQEKGIDWTIELDPSLPRELYLDKDRLKQVLVNLVGNAFQFTVRGGVVLSIKGYPSDIFDARYCNLLLTVRDTGIGIPDEAQEHIFGAFHQWDDPQYLSMSPAGAGLGLAICKRLVELMGGTIGVESQKDQGSLFSVDLREIEIVGSTGEVYVEDAETLEGGKVLIAEDDAQNRRYLRSLLKVWGLEVRSVDNGAEVQAAVREFQPQLVILDIRMPGLSGVDAAVRLAEDPETAGIPRIALSAFTEPENLAINTSLFLEYFTKPLDKPKFKDLCFRILKQNS